jgi:glucose-6-phosphate isomerase
LAAAEAHLNTLVRLGIRPDQIGAELQRQSLVDSGEYFEAMIKSVAKKREELEEQWQRMAIQLGTESEPVEDALRASVEERLMCRIWDHDQAVWGQVQPIASDPLAWLHIIEVMRENVPDLDAFTHAVVRDGFTKAVIVGMGGSSLLTRLFVRAFKPWIDLHKPSANRLELTALDSITTMDIEAITRNLDPAETLFIISSKSGETVETVALFKYIYQWIVSKLGEENAGSHFVAITNPETSLATIAGKHHFRRTFLDNPDMMGHFSALSYTGLVPAALLGVDIKRLLGRAQAMACNAHGCNQAVNGDNLAAQLGTTLGILAKSRRDKLMLSSSPLIHDFDNWIERIVAGSCGKAGQGIVPVTGELFRPGQLYKDDRIFVYHLLDGDEDINEQLALANEAGHPTITIRLKDVYDLGGLLFMWQMASAVAAHHLGVNPFTQPDLDNSKRLAGQMMEVYTRTGRLPEQETTALTAANLQAFIDSSRPNGYIAIQAFLPEDDEIVAALRRLRSHLAGRSGLAVTLGFAPRFLHRTGQLHKGGSRDGLFIQLTADPQQDLAIPDLDGGRGSTLTFGAMLQAQALGDALALRQAGRRIIHFNLGQDVLGGLERLTRIVEEQEPVFA